ncbi:MAG: histidine--tRNA ligase [Deltaproteobacteria bacterium HGW-Deltaproteobacteria-18]|jgi:histidyl-tRNA synthetase|nr:MAG: histidine--tRNA ligase [Deltaproteobacteria bacterium HGW-Deltaproteobacteria-18]PKN44282.1 MAG: histidine--tRNA ligase [Deltaproteobacteria bacterium HGW-Deltaproteobacteria-20]
MSKIQKIKGFSDLFCPESTVHTLMENLARQVFGTYGCQEVRVPILEKTELFARSIGEETDVVQKEMYTFADRKGRSLTMRPEATAGVLRAFIESGQCGSEGTTKLFACGPMFRYERPQKGRLRQFHQLDVEVLGTDAPQADAEVVLMLWTFLCKLGLKNLSLELNSLGCPECRPVFHQRLRDFLSGVDQSKLCEDCKRRSETNPLRVLDCKVPTCKELVDGAPSITDSLCPGCDEHFAQVRDILDSAQLPYRLNERLVRGLDYYQRTTFEVVSGEIGAQTAVAGGGRYDGLIKQLGGPDLPGIGFACGMERLALLYGQAQIPTPDFYLAVLDSRALNTALLLAQRMRERGFAGEVSFEARSIKAQMRQANKLGVKTCLILGQDEMEKGQIVVKDMATGVQKNIGQDDLEQALGFRKP